MHENSHGHNPWHTTSFLVKDDLASSHEIQEFWMKKNLPYVPKLFNFLAHLCQFRYAVQLYEVQKYPVTNICGRKNVPEAIT